MSEKYEFSGITKEDAIRNAEEELKIDKEALNIVVKDTTKGKTMFSILDTSRVTIEVTVNKDKIKNNKFKKENVNKAKENITVFLKKLKGIYSNDDFEYDINIDGRKIYVNIDNSKNAIWIGNKGRILESLQRILQEVATSDFRTNVRVYLNIGKYKEERKRQLYRLSDKVAKEVEESKAEKELKPMNSYERKIVHDYLNELGYETYSVGEEPKRHIRVKPNN